MRDIDYGQEKNRIIDFIRFFLNRAGKKSVVLGLSGGIDSAVIAALSAEALGHINVRAIIMPYKTSNHKNVEDAIELSEKLMLPHRVISITPYVDTYFFENAPEADVIRKGNFMARVRMCILYDLSVEYDALVVGTGNRSELLTGYTTQYGDNACAFEPIGHLYKTEVRKLAFYLGINNNIVNKPPSADLWQGQTDEDEIGMRYETLDEILYLLFDENQSAVEVIAAGFHEQEVNRVVDLYEKSHFKRKIPELIDDFLPADTFSSP